MNNPITVGIIGINQSPHYVSFEGDREWPTDGKKHKHPIQEAAEAEKRLVQRVSGDFDEILILRFRATNLAPYPFEWVDQSKTEADYGAALVRILRKCEQRF